MKYEVRGVWIVKPFFILKIMTKEHFEYLRHQAIEDFKFDNVYNYMKLVDWTWASLSGDGYIPSVKMLKRSVYNLFQDLYDNEKKQISTGGFTISLDEDGACIVFTAEETFIDSE